MKRMSWHCWVVVVAPLLVGCAREAVPRAFKAKLEALLSDEGIARALRASP
jgi:hypothetical protein